MTRILIVDDEFHMRQLLRIYLQQHHYQVDEAENGKEAYDKILKEEYDLMVLDIMMPVMDGWETLEKVRKVSDLPVLMLTAKGTTEDKVTGLTSGADDYLVKPFEEAELVARIQALLRRTQKNTEEDELLKYKGIVLNLSARIATYLEKTINLTQTEFDLLEILIKHKGKVLSREQLVELVWGIDFMGEDRTVDSHIKNLREKLRKAGLEEQIIKTVWGIGYKVE
ncbi:response regulator transcription factor [Tepidibacillus fermentans]|uniref:Two-component system response regulator ResD n=1 Tax=Tepidibacillus fermentans TaxID=1281767 RepID=A0A4R3KLR6_9BACI|nr:response regulator transcription factor [Tepidibacillus fermentans]TCS83793.1 two-component system response regulator ResD [Tepidibacillus fermentans]